MATRDWSVHTTASGEQRNCADCKHAKGWDRYPAHFRVCEAPEALAVHGGPRACADVVRAPKGACGPEGKHWVKR